MNQNNNPSMNNDNTDQSLPSNSKTHLYQISQQQILQFIEKIQCKALNQSQYDNLLKQWIQYSEERAKKVSQAEEIVNSYQKDQKNVKSNSTCLICFGQLTERKDWCRMCGMQFCLKCIGRLRVFPEDQNNSQYQIQQKPQPCCKKCDEKYKQALLILEDQRQIEIRRRAFNKIKNIERSEDDVNSNKTQHSQKHIQELLKKKKVIRNLQSLNDSIKLETLQLKKKKSWGQDVKRKLEGKYQTIRKKMSNQSSGMEGWETFAPPYACQSDSNISNLNQSMAQSVIQDQSRMVDKNKCCACIIM